MLTTVVFMKEELGFCGFSRSKRMFNFVKPSKKNQFSIHSDVCGPFVSSALKSNSDVSRRVSDGKSHVFSVFGFRDRSKIANPIIRLDAVDVVNVVRDNAIMYHPRNSVRGSSMAHDNGAFVSIAVDRGESLFSGKLSVEHAAKHLRRSNFVFKHVRGGSVPCENPSVGAVTHKLPDAINVHFEPQVADSLSVSHTREEASHVR